jgi:hypothetical protein
VVAGFRQDRGHLIIMLTVGAERPVTDEMRAAPDGQPSLPFLKKRPTSRMSDPGALPFGAAI